MSVNMNLSITDVQKVSMGFVQRKIYKMWIEFHNGKIKYTRGVYKKCQLTILGT